MDVWQGNVTDGMTLRAVIVLAPRSMSEFNAGQWAADNASGRTPSSMIKMTEDISDSFLVLVIARPAKVEAISST
jgi:hypothetical protein